MYSLLFEIKKYLLKVFDIKHLLLPFVLWGTLRLIQVNLSGKEWAISAATTHEVRVSTYRRSLQRRRGKKGPCLLRDFESFTVGLRFVVGPQNQSPLYLHFRPYDQPNFCVFMGYNFV